MGTPTDVKAEWQEKLENGGKRSRMAGKGPEWQEKGLVNLPEL